MLDRRQLCRGASGLALQGLALQGLALAPGIAAPTLPASPLARVASLDYALAQTLLAIGIAPLALTDAQDWTKWAVEPPLPPTVVNLGSDQEPNFELLARLRPDLIVTTPYLDASLPTLRRIAPCERIAIYEPASPSNSDGPLLRAEAAMARLGSLLGRERKAIAALADAAQSFADARRALSTVPRRPLVLVEFLDARHARVYGARSLWQDVLDRLDLPSGWRRQTSFWGFSTVGIAALADVPADAVLLLQEPLPPAALATLADSPVWRALPPVREGRVLRLPPTLAFGGVPAAHRFTHLLAAALPGAAG